MYAFIFDCAQHARKGPDDTETTHLCVAYRSRRAANFCQIIAFFFSPSFFFLPPQDSSFSVLEKK